MCLLVFALLDFVPPQELKFMSIELHFICLLMSVLSGGLKIMFHHIRIL